MIQNNFNLFINIYNDEKYIHDFIRSALFQTIKLKKKIIYNNFFISNTFQIFKEFLFL